MVDKNKNTNKAFLPEENLYKNKRLKNSSISEARYEFDDIIGNSKSILEVKEKCFKASITSSPILIFGETGTGKELFVHSIHNSSKRKDKSFIAQNCAAIPENLFESILFGTVKGSFTGAESRKGLFEMANGGTLYLDELNSMPMELQAKLLRTLQEGTIRKVGDTAIRHVDVRVIASVNEDPQYLMEKNKLRRDLYFRLNVVRIDLPPLRKRKEDIPLLVKYFIDKFNYKFNASIKGIEECALNELILRQWHGNIREMEHVIEGAFNLRQEGVLKAQDFSKEEMGVESTPRIVPLKEKMEELECDYIKEALIISGNNISSAAKFLGIPRQTLQYKIKKFNIHI